MTKKELNIIALTKSETQKGNFVLVLEENEGSRRIPIVIGGFEAQAIAMALEKMELPRPMTHDLTLNILERGEQQLKEVIISEVREDIFLAELVIQKNGETDTIDARTSDAVALALRKPCRIFTYEHVLDQTGIPAETEGKTTKPENKSLEDYSLSELKSLLEKALEEENYERAQEIQEVIDSKG